MAKQKKKSNLIFFVFTVLAIVISVFSISANAEERRKANVNYQILAWQIGASHSEKVIGTGDEFTLSGSAGASLVGSGSSANYQLSSGFWAQVQALRMQQLPIFRTLDGVGNNVANLDFGSVDAKLLRLAGAAYADGRSEPRGGGVTTGATLPSARAISNIVVAQTEPIFNTLGASDMFWQWGQFLDHDIDLTEAAEPHESFPIPVPADDPLFNPPGFIGLNRSIYDLATGTDDPREQINQITAFIDASQVYGSTVGRAYWKRVFLPNGTFGANLVVSSGNLLPYELSGNCPSNSNNPCFGAGDIRANEQPGLTAMHTLFMREHNRIVGVLRIAYPEWTEDELYETARLLVGAEMQRITYDEWLPLLLGANALPTYTGYDAGVNAGIANEFSTACFRFGHTMLSGNLLRLDENGQSIGEIALRDGFFNTSFILDDGIDPILRGLMTQRAQELDTQIVDDVRNFLFGAPGAGGFDLAALNIQRGRDHGLASYNDTRVALGLPRVTSFTEITSDVALQAKLTQAYSSVDDIDLWIGGLAEDAVNGGMLGETCSAILIDQFTRLRAGDRFWYENLNWTQYELDSDPDLGDNTPLSAVTLADIITWNSDITPVENPFIVHDIVAIYAIAADNDPNSALSIAAYSSDILIDIRDATADAPNKTAIILIDKDGENDTSISIAQNGMLTPLGRLPGRDGSLQTGVKEYDMTDGEQLGGFLRWALDTYATETTQTFFHFIGHGTFVMPDGAYPAQDDSRMTYEVGSNPGYTDIHPEPRVISPYDIAQMLKIGTDNGANPLDVLDLTHCFAGTVEELVELDNGSPYASIITASPSYGYISETMFGSALRALNPVDAGVVSAEKILTAYDTALSQSADGALHPALWTAVDTTQLDALKPALDALSAALDSRFDSNFAQTKALIQTAQQAAVFYDTSFEQADWTLNSEDNLVDVRAFMQQIASTFAGDAAIVSAANEVITAIDATILLTVRRAGSPYFAPDVPAWEFENAAEYSGLALFAPFTPYDNTNGEAQIAWQWQHYVTRPTTGYPNPFKLLQTSGNAPTWATIVQRYWQAETLTFADGLPPLTPLQQNGELQAVAISLPQPDAVHFGTPTRLAASVQASTHLYGVQVHFAVIVNGAVVFEETVTRAELIGGENVSNHIETDGKWTPVNDHYTIEVMVDSSNRVLEPNENNNVLTSGQRGVNARGGLVISTADVEPLIHVPTVRFQLNRDDSVRSALTSAVAVLYRFDPHPADEMMQVTTRMGDFPVTLDGTNATVSLPEDAAAGSYQAVIWGYEDGQRSSNYARVLFSYAPETEMVQTLRQFYRYAAETDAPLTFNINVANGALKWYLWSPTTPATAMMFTGGGSYTLADAVAGEYVVMVEKTGVDAVYTLSASADAGRTSTLEPQTVQMGRPLHLTTAIDTPQLIPTNVTLRTVSQTPHALIPLLTLIAVLTLTSYALHRKRRF